MQTNNWTPNEWTQENQGQDLILDKPAENCAWLDTLTSDLQMGKCPEEAVVQQLAAEAQETLAREPNVVPIPLEGRTRVLVSLC